MLQPVIRLVVLLVTLETQHVVQTEDSTIARLRFAMIVMLLVRLVMDQQTATV